MITFTHVHKDLHGNILSTVTYTVHNEGTIKDVMRDFRLFLLAASFHPETVDKYIEAD